MDNYLKLLLSPIFLILILSCARDDFSFLPLNEQWIVDKKEATRWSMVKHENLPTLTGTIEWQNYMAFLENEFKKYGVVDIYKNSWDGSSCEVWTCLNVPAYGQGGFLGYYWNKYSDISKWNSELFIQKFARFGDFQPW